MLKKFAIYDENLKIQKFYLIRKIFKYNVNYK